ncbi:hypothetical protein HZB94_03575 [Candidatus Falkowbacteria bacterium]|nr:hypothetical protein [Candidatus Falkowbacteria bacterium]
MKKFLTLTVVFTTVLWTLGLAAFVPVASAVSIAAGDLIKASGSAVYYYAADGKRYTFPTESTYKTWYKDFKGVKPLMDSELADITLAGNVVVRPGTKLVKITTVPKVFAVSPKGKLSHLKDEAAAKALYGANWSKMVIDVPDGFWTNYSDTGKTLDGTSYPEGQMVKYGADAYYVNADGTKSKVKDETAFNANKWNWDYVVTGASTISMAAGTEIAAAVDSYVDVSQGGGAGTTATTTTAGALAVSLSADTPAADYVSKGVQNALFAKFDFKATGGKAKVSEIVLQRKGLGYDADIDTVRLYNKGVQVGTDQSFNVNTHKVTFKNLAWTVETAEILSVKANINSAPSGTNDYLELVSVTADGTVSGLPIAGNAMKFSNLTIGYLDVDAVSSSSSVNVISGATDQELGCWNFTTSSAEGFYVDSIMVTNIGSAATTEALNFKIKVGSDVISGSEVAAMKTNGTVIFDLSAKPYFIDKSKVKKLCVYGDILAGITTSKTVRFQVADSKDIAARGDSSAGEALITYSAHTSFVAQSAKTNTIAQGSATLAQDAAYAPTTGTGLVVGVANNKMAAYKITAGANEGVRLTKLRVILAGTNVASTDFANWSLYKIDGGKEVAIGVTGSTSGMNVTFEDTTNGLIDVAKSLNGTIVVKADVSTSAGGNESGVHVYVGANGTATNTESRIKGIESGEYVTSGVTLSGVATGNAQTFTVGAKGTLTVSKAADSPTADTVAKGKTAYHFTTVNLYATGEDIEVTTLVLTGYETAGTGDAVETGDLSNVYLMSEDNKPIGTTVANPSSGEYSFSFSLVVPKDSNKKIKVYGDVPSGTTSSYAHIDMDTANTDITSTGVYSSADIGTSETGTATGSTMTVGGPTITAAMSTSPLATSYVINSSGVTLGKLILTAGATENVKITSIKITSDDAATLSTVSSANSDITNIKLVNANNTSTQYGVTQNFTDGTADYVSFTGIDNLTIAKGENAVINIVADIKGSSLTYYFGVYNPTVDLTGVGISSNASLAAADINSGTTTAIASTGATLTTAGLLAVNKAGDMPAAAQLVSGSTNNDIAKYKLASSYESVDITVLQLETSADISNILANVKLYFDGKQIGDSAGYIFTGTEKSINLASGTMVVTNDKTSYLTIKADINAKAQVTTTVSSTTMRIDSTAASGAAGAYTMTAKGSSSGGTVSNINSTGAAGGIVYAGNGFTFHKGILVVSKSSSSPSGTATAGTNSEVLRLDLTATGDEISLLGIDMLKSGTCTVTGTGAAYIKSGDGTVTYKTWTAGTAHLNVEKTVADGGLDTALSIGAGTTATIKLVGDTGGCTTANTTLQFTVGDGTNTNNGLIYEDSSGTNVDLSTTKNLPISGGTLYY